MKSPESRGSRLGLREIHQLRSVPSLQGRRALARCFVKQGKWGLLDATGAVWPVFVHAVSTEDGGAAGSPEALGAWDWVELCCDGVPRDGFAISARVRVLTRSRPSQMHEHLAHWLDTISFDAHGFVPAVPFPELAAHQLLHQAKKRLREYFQALGYYELEAPLCVPSGGIERYLQVFETQYRDYNGNEQPLQLPTSPEFALKKCLSRGYEKIFSLAQSFRNGGEISPWHRPQFTMLEWYTAGQSLADLIEQTSNIVELVWQTVASAGSSVFSSAAKCRAAPVLRVEELYHRFFQLDLRKVLATHKAMDFYDALKGKSISVRPDDTLDELFWKSFLDNIEPALKDYDWVFLTGFPLGFASLAGPEPGGLFAERFELFARGVEICNGYFELTDSDVMRNRFDDILLQRSDLRSDASFESAMLAGIPPCAGNALGLERLVSVIMGANGLLAGHGLDSFSSQ